jgi:hypothetical protein
MKTSFGAPLWLFAGIVLFGLFCLLSVFRK